MRQTRRIPSALKHGAYAASGLLPGENLREFYKLHDELIDEFAPNGALEDDIVLEITRHTWRKQHLATFRKANVARDLRNAIKQEKLSVAGLSSKPDKWASETSSGDAEKAGKIERAAEATARDELGADYELIEIGEIATLDYSVKELAVEDRLNAMIDRSLKRLLFVRGFKSLTPPVPVAPPLALNNGEASSGVARDQRQHSASASA